MSNFCSNNPRGINIVAGDFDRTARFLAFSSAQLPIRSRACRVIYSISHESKANWVGAGATDLKHDNRVSADDLEIRETHQQACS
jgi:hypothetical protein